MEEDEEEGEKEEEEEEEGVRSNDPESVGDYLNREFDTWLATEKVTTSTQQWERH